MTRRRRSDKQRESIIARYGDRCAECGGDGPFDLDHERALCMGGEDTDDNLRPLCKPCHKVKTARDRAVHARALRRERFMAEGRHRKRKGRELQSRGFSKAPPQQSARKPIQKWAAWREV